MQAYDDEYQYRTKYRNLQPNVICGFKIQGQLYFSFSPLFALHLRRTRLQSPFTLADRPDRTRPRNNLAPPVDVDPSAPEDKSRMERVDQGE
jgi:hypothetical protein